MSGMKDLLGDTLFTYPQRPGFKESTTSKVAADAVAPGASKGREAVFTAIAAAGAYGLTADEAAAMIGRRETYVRPRVTELSKMGRIVETGKPRRNVTNLKAKAWRAV